MTDPLARVHPSWRAPLSGVAENITAMGVFLREEIAAGRSYLPAGEHILRAFQTDFATVRVLILGQDPRERDRPLVCRLARYPAAATQFAEHLSRTSQRSRLPYAVTRRSFGLDFTGSAIAKPSPYSRARQARVASWKRLGNRHRMCHPRAGRSALLTGCNSVGQRCANDCAVPWRHTGDHECSSKPILCRPGVFRFQALFPRQRVPKAPGCWRH
jgi:hypothetical protein